ncbi:MAG: sigma 54 modulation/S30EA ribosomal C-terminal domain-containing protein [Actinobacteria bacterium]|nr:sigma 54 modulation/S30EA ribosomal C-terminal domain-containing protein [Actinomycetota bacterium]
MDDGPVPDHVRADSEEMVSRLARKAPRPVLFARVKVIVDPDRDPDEETIAQGTMDISGSIIRAQVAAPAPRDALNVLHDRLDRRLRRLAERRQTAEKRPPRTPEGEWRSGDLPAARPGYFPRPVEEREVVRRKAFSPGEEISVDEALFDLDVLDHRFFLFTDAADGEVSVVYEEDGRVMLQKVSGGTPPEVDVSLGVEPNPTPAPELEVDEAKQLLDTTNAPFVFFRHAGTGEGRVMYRRYDGHYGLVAPAE